MGYIIEFKVGKKKKKTLGCNWRHNWNEIKRIEGPRTNM
jgi:hypothetical protein